MREREEVAIRSLEKEEEEEDEEEEEEKKKKVEDRHVRASARASTRARQLEQLHWFCVSVRDTATRKELGTKANK